jgi:hypothetical protein
VRRAGGSSALCAIAGRARSVAARARVRAGVSGDREDT